MYRIFHEENYGHDTRSAVLPGYFSYRKIALEIIQGWGRTRLSVMLCELWDWRAPNGQLKDMACRNLLLRLEQAGQIRFATPPAQVHECRSQSLSTLGTSLQ